MAVKITMIICGTIIILAVLFAALLFAFRNR